MNLPSSPLILFEDSQLLVLNKPAGLPCVSLKNPLQPTVASWLARTHPGQEKVGRPGESGLVHRLDNETSGVLIAARTPTAYEELRKIWKSEATRKIYAARVTQKITSEVSGALGSASPPLFTLSPGAQIRFPVGHSAKSKRKMIAIRSDFDLKKIRGEPQKCLTKILETDEAADPSEFLLELQGGVRHQLRVHLASVGYPILGDDRYGGTPAERLHLHALSVEFMLDGKKRHYECERPW